MSTIESHPPKTPPRDLLTALHDIVVKSWITTGCGVVAAAAQYVVMFPVSIPIVNQLAQFVMVGGLAMIGICAKDGNKTHSDKK